MAAEINLGGTIYISSKQGAELVGYTQDYVGQLARSGTIEAKRVSGLWYVTEESLRKHKASADEYVPKAPNRSAAAQEVEAAVSFDGKDYISSHRASKVTGYNQDYIGQLARSGQILSRQIGNRWYVDRQSLLDHKASKDALLAALQTEAVGLPNKLEPDVEEASVDQSSDTHFQYMKEEGDLLPDLLKEPSFEAYNRDLYFGAKPTLPPLNANKPSMNSIEPAAREEVNQIRIRVIENENEPISDESRIASITPIGQKSHISVSEGAQLSLDVNSHISLPYRSPEANYKAIASTKSRRPSLITVFLVFVMAIGVVGSGIYVFTPGLSDQVASVTTGIGSTRSDNPVITNTAEGARGLLESIFSKEIVYKR